MVISINRLEIYVNKRHIISMFEIRLTNLESWLTQALYYRTEIICLVGWLVVWLMTLFSGTGLHNTFIRYLRRKPMLTLHISKLKLYNPPRPPYFSSGALVNKPGWSCSNGRLNYKQKTWQQITDTRNIYSLLTKKNHNTIIAHLRAKQPLLANK
jgi:hypothetical protein